MRGAPENGPSNAAEARSAAPGSRVDIREGETGGGTAHGRPWLGVLFRCSGQYRRVFRNAQGTAYVARCPGCGKVVRFRVGEGGMSARFFEVSC